MLTLLDSLRNYDLIGVLARTIIALICVTPIGLERTGKDRPAGFRTHVLVILGALVASMTGHYIFLGMGLPADVTRLPAQVVAGLGFLGAGTIILTKRNGVKGLTTAAGLWTTGVVGLAVGAGFYEGAVLCSILVFITEKYAGKLKKNVARNTGVRIRITYADPEVLDSAFKLCSKIGHKVSKMKVEKLEDGLYQATVSVYLHLSMTKEEFEKEIKAIEGVKEAYCLEGTGRTEK